MLGKGLYDGGRNQSLEAQREGPTQDLSLALDFHVSAISCTHLLPLSTPQVEQSYLVLFCTHASQLQDHVQGMVLTILVRGHGVVEARGLSQGCVVLDMTRVMEFCGQYFGLCLGFLLR